MLFSGGMIPNYLLIKELRLLNSIWSLILPQIASAYNILILRNFFQAIPSELEESASIDGASQFRILAQVILPVSIPVPSMRTRYIMLFFPEKVSCPRSSLGRVRNT